MGLVTKVRTVVATFMGMRRARSDLGAMKASRRKKVMRISANMTTAQKGGEGEGGGKEDWKNQNGTHENRQCSMAKRQKCREKVFGNRKW